MKFQWKWTQFIIIKMEYAIIAIENIHYFSEGIFP